MRVLRGGFSALHEAGYPIDAAQTERPATDATVPGPSPARSEWPLDVRGRRAGLPFVGRKAVIAGGVGALLGAVGFALFATRGPVIDPRGVAVAAIADHSGDPTLASLGPLATDWVTEVVRRWGAVTVDRTRAGTVIAGFYRRDGDSVRLELQVIDVRRGTVWRALDPIAAPARAPLEAEDAVRRRVAAALDTLFARL